MPSGEIDRCPDERVGDPQHVFEPAHLSDRRGDRVSRRWVGDRALLDVEHDHRRRTSSLGEPLLQQIHCCLRLDTGHAESRRSRPHRQHG
ncbi:MAG: hypothetical protein V9G12_18695 [Microthrixaceae bacterium]